MSLLFFTFYFVICSIAQAFVLSILKATNISVWKRYSCRHYTRWVPCVEQVALPPSKHLLSIPGC